MWRWLNSQEEFAAAWTALGVVMGALITGFFMRRTKQIETKTTLELEQEKDAAAFQERLLQRIEQLDKHVTTLEEIANKNRTKITELERALVKAEGEIQALRAENSQLKKMLHCEKGDCPLTKEKGG